MNKKVENIYIMTNSPTDPCRERRVTSNQTRIQSNTNAIYQLPTRHQLECLTKLPESQMKSDFSDNVFIKNIPRRLDLQIGEGGEDGDGLVS